MASSKQHPSFERRKYHDWEAEPKNEDDASFASTSGWPKPSIRRAKRRRSLPVAFLVAGILLIVFGLLSMTYFAGILRH